MSKAVYTRPSGICDLLAEPVLSDAREDELDALCGRVDAVGDALRSGAHAEAAAQLRELGERCLALAGAAPGAE